EDRTTPALFDVQPALTPGQLNNNGFVAVADFNKDGLDDAVMTNFGTNYTTGAGTAITLLYGKAGGGFDRLSLNTSGQNVSFAAVADIDGDTWPDVVATNANRQNIGSVSVFKNDGAGNLSLFATPFSTFSNNPSWIGLTDVTGDGVLDAVVASFGKEEGENVVGNNIQIFEGNGDFTFDAAPITTLAPEIQFIPTAAVVADLDGDGFKDIAAAVPGVPPEFGVPQIEGNVYVFKGTGLGGFASPNLYGSGGVFPVNIQAGYLNADTKLDLVVANAGDPNGFPQWVDDGVGVLLNVSSPGNPSFGVTNTITAGTAGPFATAIADFDLDGNADIAAVNFGTTSANVAMYMGTGTGSFNGGNPLTYDTGTGSAGGQYLAVGNFGGNGSPDLIVSHESNKVGLMFNTSVQAPTVTINQAAGQADPTTTGPISYTVQFSEAVTGFDATDISFTGSTVGGTLSAAVTGTGPTYTVTVSGMTGQGLVRASIPAGAATSVSQSTATLASTSTDNTVTFDTVGPTVTINQAAGQADPTDVGPILFTVQFNEPVTGFTAADVSLGGSSLTGLSASVTQVNPSTYTVSVTGMAGTGTVIATVGAGAATDAAGNASAASTSTDNSVTFGNIAAPTVTINQAAGQADPTNVGPISYTVQFSEPVTGFDGTDISFAGSTVGGTLSAAVTGTGPTYTVTVSGMSGAGNVVATVKPNAAVNSINVGNAASTSADNTVAFDATPPTVTINQAAGQADPSGTPSVQFAVKFNEPVTGFNASDVSLSGSTVGGTLSVAVTGSLDTYVVTVTGMTTGGFVVATVPAGGSTDAAGNANLASTSTDNSIRFVNTGTVGFSDAVFTGTEDDGSVTITVTRAGGADGKVSVDFTSAPDTAHIGGQAIIGQNDYTPVTRTLTWEDGEDGPQTFTIPILQDGLNEGKELITLGLTPTPNLPPGQLPPALGLSEAAAAIAPSDGQGPGTYLDSDNDKVTIKLGGRTGSLLFFRTDPDGDGRGPIELIELTGTLPNPLRPKAVLNITVKKALATTADGGTVNLGAVTGPGLKAINAPKANLNLEGVNLTGYLGSLKIGNILNGADVVALATSNPLQKTRINAKVIADGTSIDVGAKLGSLIATSFGTGSIKAPSAGLINIKGDMAADVDLSGAGVLPTQKALTTLRVKGAVTDSDVKVTGHVGSVTVGAFRDSRLLVGYTGPDVPEQSGFTTPAALTTFRATGPSNAFQNSYVFATSFRAVTLTSVDFDNENKEFGFYADVSVGSVCVIGPT
ncbi:MAG TPA: Ig-like domain-containing protein, partial [Gemmataceae bacterium]|nr:Ig-like domain-containing protein [Gemmataceae bacterium]